MMCPPLEGDIESSMNAVAPYGSRWVHKRRRANSGPLGLDDRVFVVEGYPGAAEHDWVPAVPNCIGINIASVQWSFWKRLPRHPNQLEPVSENKLRTEVKMGFDKTSVPCGSHGSVRKCPIGRSIRSEEYILVPFRKNGRNLRLPVFQSPIKPT